MDKKLLRIVDANYNRTKEALRVCEDITRFLLDDVILTKKFKSARHKVTEIIKKSPVGYEKVVLERQSAKDVGKDLDLKKRKGIEGLLLSNIQRAKESLRVLEEIYKTLDQKISGQFKNIRFSVYSLEKSAVKKIKKYDSVRKS